jgi:hypothetical protein
MYSIYVSASSPSQSRLACVPSINKRGYECYTTLNTELPNNVLSTQKAITDIDNTATVYIPFKKL